MRRQRQQGMTLAMTLVFLFLISLVGVGGAMIRSNERLAMVSSLDFERALQKADSGLRYAEEDIRKNLASLNDAAFTASCASGLCQAGTVDPLTFDWGNLFKTRAGIDEGDGAGPPVYIVERIAVADAMVGSGSLVTGFGAQSTVRYYRITARAESSRNNGRVIVQEIYRY